MIYKPKFNLKDTVYIDRKFSSLSSSFFKPIVATSLLFLLPSLGMGEDNVYTVGGNTGPTIKVTSTESTPSNLSWSSTCSNATCSATSGSTTANWTNTGGTWSGTFNSDSSKTINYLILRFNSTDTSYVYLDTNSSVANVYASGNKASAITADFNNENLSITKLELYLSGTGTKNISVKNLNTLTGGLNIGGTGTTENQYTYDVAVNTINGDLTVFGSNYALKGTVTINKELKGNIYVSRDSSAGTSSNANATSTTAALTVNFVNGATMTGDIADRDNGVAGIRKDIYFTGASSGTTVFTGNIVSFGTTSGNEALNTSAGNRVYFTQGDMKGYIIASTGQVGGKSSSSTAGDVSKKGLNVVVFGDTTGTTTQTLTGGILASDANGRTASTDTNSTQATNVIVLADSTTLNINTDSSSNGTLNGSFAGGNVVGGDVGSSTSSTSFSVTSGSIVARNYGVNEIRIYKDSTLNLNDGKGSIQSVITSKTSVTKTDGSTTTGTTVSNGSALNKINFLSEGGVIKGSIVADNSGNSGSTNKASALIYVANNASGTITGDLTTKSNSSGTNGRMLITLGSSNMTPDITGVDLKNATDSSTSTSGTNISTLTLQGSSNTITGLTTTAPTSGTTNTASLVLDSSNSSTGQTTTISGTVTNNASALNFIFKGNNKNTLDMSSAKGSADNMNIEVQDKTEAIFLTGGSASTTGTKNTITFAKDSKGSLSIKTSDSSTDSSISVTSGALTVNFYGSGTLNDGLTLSSTSTGTASLVVGGTDNSGNVTATINGVLSKDSAATGSISLTFNGNSNVLNLNGITSTTASTAADSSTTVAQTIDTLSGSGTGNVINLSTISGDTVQTRTTFQTLTVKSLTASSPVTFLLYVNPSATTSGSSGGDSATVAAADSDSTSTTTTVLADRVIIEGSSSATTQDTSTSTSTASTVHYLSITGNTADLTSGDLSSKNIALATVKSDSGITLQAKESTIGFNTVKFTTTTKSTKQDGTVDTTASNNTYTTYFLGSATYTGVAETDMTKSARNSLALGYNLFLANFNSLNKRMGELRNNAHSQGVWGRIFLNC